MQCRPIGRYWQLLCDKLQRILAFIHNVFVNSWDAMVSWFRQPWRTGSEIRRIDIFLMLDLAACLVLLFLDILKKAG